SYNTLTLLRTDNYCQFFSSDIESLDAYLEPVANDLMKRITKNFLEQVNVSVKEAKTGKDTYSFSISDDTYHSLVSAKYIPDYKLWVVGSTDLSHVDGIFV
ncbi:GGDEF-domain containing protein, partial [Vibrio lentus]|nr:GGDEF-domain containing protein [Vibrio lentus]